MRFAYRASLLPLAAGEDVGLVLRPEIPVVLIGPNGRANLFGLVDTGADATIFPKHLARRLGIVLRPDMELRATAFGGASLEFEIGEADIELQAGDRVIQWHETLCFFDLPEGEGLAVLGHAGFLDYFAATFDGKDCALTLIPNELLPAASLK